MNKFLVNMMESRMWVWVWVTVPPFQEVPFKVEVAQVKFKYNLTLLPAIFLREFGASF
jgi:hypothetical protein